MKILAIDTSAAIGGVALLSGGEVVGGVDLRERSAHAVALPLAVAGLLAEAGWTASHLDLLVVTLGPGSFTGVRIALGWAKGFALAWRGPVVGVSTLEVLAAGCPGSSGPVVSVMVARRGEIILAGYTVEAEAGWGGARSRVTASWCPPTLMAPEGVVALPWLRPAAGGDPADYLWVGDGLPLVRKVLAEGGFPPLREAEAACWRVDPVVLGRVGLVRFEREGASPIDRLEPLYWRASHPDVGH